MTCSSWALLVAVSLLGPFGLWSVPGAAQYPSQVDDCLGVDVFVGGRIEEFGVGREGDGGLAAPVLVD